VAIVDDDSASLNSIARILKINGFNVTAYTSPDRLLADIARLDPACLIVDLAMPEMSGLELQHALTANGSRCAVVFVSGHGDIRTTVQAMREGAIDFLVKPLDADDLLAAVGLGIARSNEFRAHCEQADQVRQCVASLTAREREVFEQVIAGMLNKQIAASLGIAEKTVKVHRGRVMRKMGARSVAQLVHDAGLLGDPGMVHSV
jgi:FixJ family two-component response regulator